MTTDTQKTKKDLLTNLFIVSQYILPQHLLSRAVGYLARSEVTWLKNLLIKRFIRAFKVNMEDALISDPEQFSCFNEFFCRQLKPAIRPISDVVGGISSPADGVFSQLGKIEGECIFQAKGHSFTCTELLGGQPSTAAQFEDGSFATIYLSPKDYHRLHMPVNGKLTQMTHVPGALFSVNAQTAASVPRLFARNERLVCMFDTEHGPMAMVLVGAMIVASIETVWAGLVAPRSSAVTTVDYQTPADIRLKQGEEMGRFMLGSTVVLLFPKGAANWLESIQPGQDVKMGELVAETCSHPCDF
ncbi:MAG: phosphatidylserine decarboxylase [Alteromonadaceae bacterium]|nr:MAG: phosphatidylserine decarboxylase [Alteromonadaceae bacterium]